MSFSLRRCSATRNGTLAAIFVVLPVAMRRLDVLSLFPFVSPAEEDHELFAECAAVDPVSRPVIDAELEHALPHRLPVAAKADAQSIDSRQNTHARRSIAKRSAAQRSDPFTERTAPVS